jgi:hypothetical protein
MRRRQHYNNIIGLLILGVVVAGCEEGRGPYYTCFHVGPVLEYTCIRDYDYARCRFFDLGVTRDPVGDTLMRFLRPADVIKNIRVYQQVDDDAEQAGVAYAYWQDKEREGLAGTRITARFRDVTASTAVGHNPDRLYLYTAMPIDGVEDAALAYYVEVSHWIVDTIGDVSGDTLQLQLLKLPLPDPSDPLWDAEWKNLCNVEREYYSFNDLQIDIFKGAPGTEESGANRAMRVSAETPRVITSPSASGHIRETLSSATPTSFLTPRQSQ